MNLSFYLTNGRQIDLEQDEEAAAAAIRENLKPKTLFAAAAAILAGPSSIGGIVMEHVEAISIAATPPFVLAPPPGIDEIRLLERAAFDEVVRKDGPHIAEAARLARPGDHLSYFMSCQMVSGRAYFMAIRGRLQAKWDQMARVKGVSEMPYLALTAADGTVHILNPAKLGLYFVFPGPPHAPAEAFPFQRLKAS